MNRRERRRAASKSPRAVRESQERQTSLERKEQLRSGVARELERRKVRLPLLASTAQARLDNHIERELPPDVSCKPGCSACCRQMVLTSLAEALLIVQRYPEVVADVRATLVRQVALADRVAPFKEIDPVSSPEKVEEIASIWWVQQQDCAFLGSDKRCRVYDARPLVCRRYHAVSEPELCSGPLGTDILGWVPSTADQLLLGLWNEEADEQGRVQVGPLPHIVLSADSGLKALEAMKEGKK